MLVGRLASTPVSACRACNVLDYRRLSPGAPRRSVQAQAGTAGLGGGIAYVFLQSAFASAGITSLRGQGFVLARAGSKWTAPAYISLYKLGAGLSIGALRAPVQV